MIDQIMAVITGSQMFALFALMIINVILSIAVAIAKGEFSFDELPKFIPNRVWPLIAYVMVALLAAFSSEWAPIAIAVYAGLVVLYTKGILAAVKSITGLQIPDILIEPVATILARKK